MNLQKYRLNDWSELSKFKDEMGIEEYNAYTDKVYSVLLNLPPGKFYSVNKLAKPENFDLFIKICCLFIHSNHQYTMSSDYSKIIHLST